MEDSGRMNVPTYAQLRAAVNQAAEDLDHPTKVMVDRDGNETPHKYGRVVYFEGGHVGAKIGSQYLIAEGESHELSVWALAHRADATPFDPKVKVQRVSAGHFWLRCAAGK
jgi:hypothetical protein